MHTSRGLRERDEMLEWIAKYWCRAMHQKAMWPIHGRYICPECLREHPVEWEVLPEAVPHSAQHTKREEELPDGVQVLN